MALARNGSFVEYPVMVEEFEKLKDVNAGLMSRFKKLTVENKILLDASAKYADAIASSSAFIDHLVSIIQTTNPDFNFNSVKKFFLRQD